MRGMKYVSTRKVIGVALHIMGGVIALSAMSMQRAEGILYFVGFGLLFIGATVAPLTPD